MSQPKKKPAKPSSSDLLDKYRPAAKKLKPEDVQVCRANTRVAFANVKTGVLGLFGPEDDKQQRKARVAAVQEQLPKLDAKKAAKLPELARAVMLAAQLVAPPVSDEEIDQKLAAVGALREPILTTAEVLAGQGLLPKDKVAKIRSGSGKYDVASDGVALADLFTTHAAAIHGKHPFTAEQIATMRESAEWLLDRLTPAGAKKAPPSKRDDADLRDRLWTLLVRAHADLRVMGYVMFREDFDAKVPKLQSSAGAQQAEEPAPTNGAAQPAKGGAAQPTAGG